MRTNRLFLLFVWLTVISMAAPTFAVTSNMPEWGDWDKVLYTGPRLSIASSESSWEDKYLVRIIHFLTSVQYTETKYHSQFPTYGGGTEVHWTPEHLDWKYAIIMYGGKWSIVKDSRGDNRLDFDTLRQSGTSPITSIVFLGNPKEGIPIPEPSTLMLLGSGLAGFAMWSMRKRFTRQ